MIFPALAALDLSATIERRVAANIAHIVAVDWVDYPWPMTRDQWADWWQDAIKQQSHLLPALTEAQLAALTEAYSYALESNVPREQCAQSIIALLAAVGFDHLTEQVSAPFGEAPSPKAQGHRQRELLDAVAEAPGTTREALLDDLLQNHPKRGDKRKTYRRALAAMLEAGILVERNGQLYSGETGEDFSDLLGITS